MRAIQVKAQAQARIDPQVRHAREQFSNFEDRAATAFLKYAGRAAEHRVVREIAGRRRNDRLIDFAAVMEHLEIRSPYLSAGRLKFHFDGLATQLFADFKKTVIYSAYTDTETKYPDANLALVFNWPRVKHCRGWCVCHRLPVGEARLQDGWFRLWLPVKSRMFAIEPLPSFLGLIGFAPVELDDDEGD